MRRVATIALTVIVAVAGAGALIAFFQSRDDARIGGDQTETVPGVKAPEETDPRLKAGNVILTYRRAEDGAVLDALAEDIAGPPDDAVVEAGQAVIVLRRPNQAAGQVVGHAAGRRIVADQPDDPKVREFVEYWLGRAAG